MSKNAIVALTRGYEDIKKYEELISRNTAIYDIFYSNVENKGDYDIIIYHEGNITIDQQKWIQSQTPQLPLLFIIVEFVDFKYDNYDNYICKPTKLSDSFPEGYKNMCNFWSISFLSYLSAYNYIIRIDEDCVIKKFPADIIDQYKKNNIMYASPYFQNERDGIDVTLGMEELFQNLNGGIKYFDIKFPYSNIFIINIPYFAKNQGVIQALEKIRETGCIFINRWGDLPIWGFILKYYIPPENYIEEKKIIYYHSSHQKLLNDVENFTIYPNYNFTLQNIILVILFTTVVLLVFFFYFT